MKGGRRPGCRRGALLLLAVAGCLAGTLGVAPAASAHPLGNATVNHYDGLQLYPDHVSDTAVEDVAEIPTLQRKPLIDADGNGTLSPGELTAYAGRQCDALAAADRIVVGGTHLTLRVASADYNQRPGAIQLSTGRLVCQLTAPVDLSSATTVSIEDEWDGAGIGWHELTAVGHGVVLHDSPMPATSVSDALRRYPNDLLSSPLDQRSATVSVTPGADASTYASTHGLPTSGFAARWLGDLTTTFNGLVGRQRLTLGVGLLAMLLAMVLGAGHAFLPGHGKTIMAAYLVGKRGRYRDVATVGATVTLTHTAGVLVIGLLLSVSATLAPTAVEQDLAVLSGVIVAGVGLWLLIAALRGRAAGPGLGEELATLATDAEAPQTFGSAVPTPALAPTSALAYAVTVSTPAEHCHDGSANGHDGVHGSAHGRGHSHGEYGHPRDDHGGHSHSPGEHSHGEQAHGEQAPGHPAAEGHDHGPAHRHGLFGRHSHSHTHHSHTPGTVTPGEEPAGATVVGFSRKGLVGLGVAGGLVPSPSALLVLLAAVALGRTVFGIVLVLGYGVGMAGALTAAGLLLVRVRSRLGRIATSSRVRRVGWLLAALPVLTASLVLIVGVGLALRALTGTV